MMMMMPRLMSATLITIFISDAVYLFTPMLEPTMPRLLRFCLVYFITLTAFADAEDQRDADTPLPMLPPRRPILRQMLIRHFAFRCCHDYAG